MPELLQRQYRCYGHSKMSFGFTLEERQSGFKPVDFLLLMYENLVYGNL